MRVIKRMFSAVLLAAVMTASVSSMICNAETTDIDINSDGKVNVFDWIVQKREDISSDKLSIIRDFLLGKEINGGSLYPIDESAILEPKGTVHYGEGTFYGGGYEGAVLCLTLCRQIYGLRL